MAESIPKRFVDESRRGLWRTLSASRSSGAAPTARRTDRTAPQHQAPDRRLTKRRCRTTERPTGA
ncbi:MAG: hypothetical protein HY584_01035 [Candidatus Omnitrophica bacterium]|nr:hypothetical protein [Candidatus Omnitrophota bacterium]